MAARKENLELQERCQEIRLYSAGAEAGDAAAAAAAAAERLRAASDESSQADEEEGRETEAQERRPSGGASAVATGATTAVTTPAMVSPIAGERERSATAAATVMGGSGGTVGVGTGEESAGEERLAMQGWLHKLGGKSNNKWQRRHFSLAFAAESNIYTVVYRAKDRGPVKGRVALPWCTVRRGAAAMQEAGLKASVLGKVEAECMLLLCPRMVEKKKKNYVLAAASRAELQLWVDALETAACFLPSAEDILRTGTYKLLDQSQV